MSGLADTLVLVAATNAVLAACACGAVWAVRRRGGPPAIVHALWLVVLARLLMPPLVAVPILPAFAPSPSPVTSPSSASAAVPGPIAGAERPTFDRLTAVAALWGAGSCAILVLALRRRRRMIRLVAGSPPPPPRLTRLADSLADDYGLAKRPRLVVVDARVSPMVWSAPGGACVVLPAALVARASDAALEAILAHELAHLRRRDHWTRRLELAATILCWWAPALWWARAGLRRAEERCCDQWVVRVRPALAEAYARALVDTAAFVNESNTRGERLPALASGAGPVRHLEERLTMIMNHDRAGSGSSGQRLALAAIAAVALLFAPAAIDSSSAGEPPARDALARDAAAADAAVEVERELELRLAELLEQRRAIEAEIDALAGRGVQVGRAVDPVRLDDERALARAARDRARAMRELSVGERVERRRAERDVHRAAIDAERALAKAIREERRGSGHALRDDARVHGERLRRAVRARIEATILELEADGLTEHAERLRRELDAMP